MSRVSVFHSSTSFVLKLVVYSKNRSNKIRFSLSLFFPILKLETYENIININLNIYKYHWTNKAFGIPTVIKFYFFYRYINISSYNV